jgi:repressor LexA
MTVADRIKQRRESLSISQTALADMVNITKQQMYKYEKGIITNIPSDKIESIAKALNTTPAYLMGWSDTITPTTSDFTPTVQCETPDECDLVLNYRQLNPSGKEYIRQTISITLQAYSEKNDAVSELETAQ